MQTEIKIARESINGVVLGVERMGKELAGVNHNEEEEEGEIIMKQVKREEEVPFES